MMRFALVAAVWLLFVGGVWFYMHTRDALRTQETFHEIAPVSADARYDVELTLTFDAQPDPFALVSDDSEAPPVVTVRLNDRNVAEMREGLPPGTPWVQTNIDGVVVGANELYIEAIPPVEQTDVRHAVRLRILQDNEVLADRTFWSDGGANVTGVLGFEIAAGESEAHHGQ